MSIVDRIRGFLGRKGFFGIVPTWQAGIAQYTPHSYENFAKEGYRKNEIIYACIREIATSAAEPRMVAFRKRRNGETERVLDHPLRKLIERPNPFITEQDLWEIVLTHLNIAGNSYIAKIRTNAGRVAELWPLRPDRMRIIPSRDRYIEGYQYEVGAQKRPIEPKDMIHLKYYDPANDFYGFSPIAVAARVGDVDNAATDFLKRFFDQGVQIPGALIFKGGTATRAEKERVRKEWRKYYGGFKKWTDVAVLDTDVEYQKIGLNFQEMDFRNLRAMSEARICSVFGVPPILAGIQIGLERSTFSNYREAKRSFWDETLMPLFRKIRDKFQIELATEFGDDILLEFDLSRVAALQEDENEKYDRLSAAIQAGWLTVNEARAMIGLNPVADGDIFLRQMMLLGVPGEAAKFFASTEVKAIPNTVSHGIESVKGPIPREKAEPYWRGIDLAARAWEGVFADKAKALFAEEKEAVLKILRKEGKAAKQGVPFQDFLFSSEEYFRMRRDSWEEEYLPLFQALMSAQGENITAAFGIAFNVENIEVLRFLSEYSFKFAEGIVGKSGEIVADIIFEGQQEGWTVRDMREALTEAFEQFDTVRAERIARTETIRSSNAGAVEAYRLAGIHKKEWYATIDGRQCGYCEALHETVLDVQEIFLEDGQEFQPEGMESPLKVGYGDVGYPPAHVSCRCAVLPVIEEV